MASVNKVTLLGNLGADPEMKTFESGSKITTIRVATTEKYNDRNGNTVEATEWHRVEFFGKVAEVAAQWLKKGDSVYLEGKIKTEKYTDQQGIERYTTKINANTMQMLGKRTTGSTGAIATPAHTGGPAATPPIGATDDDDLPF